MSTVKSEDNQTPVIVAVKVTSGIPNTVCVVLPFCSTAAGFHGHLLTCFVFPIWTFKVLNTFI